MARSLRIYAFLLALAFALGPAKFAAAEIITISGFSGSEAVITFDELAGTPAIGPFSIGAVTFTEASTGSGGPGWKLLPFGFAGSTAPSLADNAGNSLITLAFSIPVNRVGLVVGVGPATYQVSIFGAANNLLESALVSLNGNFDGAFIGFQQPVNIARLQITESTGDNGLIGAIDNVRFESVRVNATPVPEPASLAIWSLISVAGLTAFRCRRQ